MSIENDCRDGEFCIEESSFFKSTLLGEVDFTCGARFVSSYFLNISCKLRSKYLPDFSLLALGRFCLFSRLSGEVGIMSSGFFSLLNEKLLWR